jgi:FMN phosphatase YigB (HAD superfamily)
VPDPSGDGRPLHAVLFDLDDTLFPQRDWLDGAWEAVAARASDLGIATHEELAQALRRVAAEGSAAGRIIDRALLSLGCGLDHVPVLVASFLAHRPPTLELYPGVLDALRTLAAQCPVGVVTDGAPGIQRGKIDALGIESLLDVVVVSDDLGRERRKPHPAPFARALAALGLPAGNVAFVGDNPFKDMAGAAEAGLVPVRVRTGEYATEPDIVPPAYDVADVTVAISLLLAIVRPPSAGAGPEPRS